MLTREKKANRNLIRILVAVLLCVGAYAAFVVIDRVNRFYFTFGIEVAYQGQSLTIERTIACVPSTGDVVPVTGRSQAAMAERLADDSGLLVIIPSLCDPEVWPLATNFVPQIFWTEDADQPDVLEAYLSENQVRTGRLTLLKVFAHPASAADYVGASLDFALLGPDPSSDPYRTYDGEGFQYFSVVARVITASEWKSVPEIAAFVSDSRKAGNLQPDRYLPFDMFFPTMTQWTAVRGGTPQPEVRAADKDALERMLPFRWTGHQFEMDRSMPGMALFYRADHVPPLNRAVSDANTPGVTRMHEGGDPSIAGAAKWPVKFGTAHCRSGHPAYCYDTQSGEIAEFQLLTIFLVENNSDR